MARRSAAVFGWCLFGADAHTHKMCPGTIQGGFWNKGLWQKTEKITCACKKCKHKPPPETAEVKGDLL